MSQNFNICSSPWTSDISPTCVYTWDSESLFSICCLSTSKTPLFYVKNFGSAFWIYYLYAIVFCIVRCSWASRFDSRNVITIMFTCLIFLIKNQICLFGYRFFVLCFNHLMASPFFLKSPLVFSNMMSKYQIYLLVYSSPTWGFESP